MARLTVDPFVLEETHASDAQAWVLACLECRLGASVVVTNLELMKNSTRAALRDLVKTRLEVAFAALRNRSCPHAVEH